MTREEIARYIDHTNLNPKASSLDIEHLCKEALQYGFASCMRKSLQSKTGRGAS